MLIILVFHVSKYVLCMNVHATEVTTGVLK